MSLSCSTWPILLPSLARTETSELGNAQGEVETLWAKLVEREKQLNMSKMGARDLSHVVKSMKEALEQSRRESKTMQESLNALQVGGCGRCCGLLHGNRDPFPSSSAEKICAGAEETCYKQRLSFSASC